MVLFILFPGHNLPSSKIWEMSMDDKMIKSNFIKELKKLGKVYKYVNNVYKVRNIPPASPKIEKFIKHFREKADKLKIEQFDINLECKKIYNNIKKIKDDIIVIGHSLGGLYANHFSKLYPKRVKKIILIESVKLIPKYQIIKVDNKYKRITKTKIEKIEKNILSNINIDENMEYLDKLIWYKSFQYQKKLNGKLLVPTLAFQNIKTTRDMDRIIKLHNYEKDMYKINKNKISFINLIDTNHNPWLIPEYCDEMIRQIKCFIN